MSQEGSQGQFDPVEHVNPMFSSEYKPFGQDWLLGTGYNVLSGMMQQRMGQQGAFDFTRMPNSGLTPPESMYIQMRQGLDNIEQMRQELVRDQSGRIYDQARLMSMSMGMPDLARQLGRAGSGPLGQQLAWQMMAHPITSQALFGGQRPMAEAMTELAVSGTMMHRGLVPPSELTADSPGELLMNAWGTRQQRGFESGMGLLNAINAQMFGGGGAPMLPNTGYTSGWAPEEMYGLATRLIQSGNPAFSGRGPRPPPDVLAGYVGRMGESLASGRMMFGDIGMPQMVQSAQMLMQQDIGSINPDEFKRHVERFAAVTAALGQSAGRMREIYFNMQQAVTAFQFDPADPAGTRTTDMMGRPRLGGLTRGYTEAGFDMAGQMMAAGVSPMEAMQSSGQIMGRAQLSTMGGAIEMVQLMRAGGMITGAQAEAFEAAVATGRTGAPTEQFRQIVEPLMGMDQAMQILRDPTLRNEWRSRTIANIRANAETPEIADRLIREAAQRSGTQMFQRSYSEYIERRRDILAGAEGDLGRGLARSLGVNIRSPGMMPDDERIRILAETAGDVSLGEGNAAINIRSEIERMRAGGSSYGQITSFLRETLGGAAADVVTQAERAQQGILLKNAQSVAGGPMGDITSALYSGGLFKGEAGGATLDGIRTSLGEGDVVGARAKLNKYMEGMSEGDRKAAANLIDLQEKKFRARVEAAGKQQQDIEGLRGALATGTPDTTIAFVRTTKTLGGINYLDAMRNMEAASAPEVAGLYGKSVDMFLAGANEAMAESEAGKTFAGKIRGYILDPTKWSSGGAEQWIGEAGGEERALGALTAMGISGESQAKATLDAFQGAREKDEKLSFTKFMSDKGRADEIKKVKDEGKADRAVGRSAAGGRGPMEVRLAPGTRLIIIRDNKEEMAEVPQAGL